MTRRRNEARLVWVNRRSHRLEMAALARAVAAARRLAPARR